MRFGAAAMLAIAMCAPHGPAFGGAMPVLPPRERLRADPLPSVSLKRETTRGLNAAQLARLSAKNARRKRKR